MLNIEKSLFVNAFFFVLLIMVITGYVVYQKMTTEHSWTSIIQQRLFSWSAPIYVIYLLSIICIVINIIVYFIVKRNESLTYLQDFF